MASTEIKDYIKKQQEIGTTDNIIREKLASVGWISEDIDIAFIEIEKEKNISSIRSISEKARSVPTGASSGYTKDPYHEPIGMGKPEAQTFIKKEENVKTSSVSRDWGTPNIDNNKPIEPRQGQKFSPQYKAVPMDPGESKNMIPDLKKAEASFVGTSFVPKKESAPVSVQVPTTNDALPRVAPASAFKVMPKSVDQVTQTMSANSGPGLSDIQYEKLVENAMQGEKKSHFFGWFVFFIVFLLILGSTIIFADIKGYINLPIDIPIIESLKKEPVVEVEEKEEIFIPNIESVDLNINNTQEGTVVEDKEVELEVKQEIILTDDEESTPVESSTENQINQ